MNPTQVDIDSLKHALAVLDSPSRAAEDKVWSVIVLWLRSMVEQQIKAMEHPSG